MAEELIAKTVVIIGTAREDTATLLSKMTSTAIDEVILYNAPQAILGQQQAEELLREMQIVAKNMSFSTSTELSDITKSDLALFWGYSFVPGKDDSLVAARKFFKKLVAAVEDDEEVSTTFLFPDNFNGLIYGNLLNSLFAASEDIENPPEIRIISSIAVAGVSVFGNGVDSACAWPSPDGFFIQEGINDEEYSKLDFYRDCGQENRRPHFYEGVALADTVKLFCMSRTKEDLDKNLNYRNKIIGRLPEKKEAEKLDVSETNILFLPVKSTDTMDLRPEVVNIIKTSEFEMEKALKFFKD